MANHGAGTKFASVNLNKSYGQSPNHHHQQHYNAAHSGFYTSNRARPGTGGAAGGGMVVLSRPRSSQKTGSKLSVPPPLNLPSLRKEHERFDPTGSGGGHASGGVSGNGSRPSSSGVGWTKPATVALQEKDGSSVNHLSDTDRNGGVVGKSSNGVYMPPSTRSAGMEPLASSPSLVFPPLHKATVLKGEDFPSLQAALPAVSGTEKKQKDGVNQKYPQMGVEESFYVQTTGSRSSSLVTMRHQLQSGNDRGHSLLNENNREGVGLSGKARKQDDCFPGPLPLVRLNPRSDWADDERDVSRSLSDQGHMTDRGRDHLHSKIDAYWDSEFDLPRTSMLLHRPANSLVNKWRQHDNEIGKTSSSEVNKTDSYGQDMITTIGEGQVANSWRVSSPFPRDGFATEAVVDRNGDVARPSIIKEKDNKYIPSTLRGSAQDGVRWESGQAQVGQHPWSNPTESFNTRGPDANRRESFASDQFHKYKNDTFLNSSVSKLNSSIGSKGLPVMNSIASFGMEKRPFGKNDKLYAEDPFSKDFTVTGLDGHDTFPGRVAAVVKRKKDILKETNFHDPVRDSFEAELERVQKMQEQERQRVIEEQERALEMARREEEERIRLVKEQEEKQRRVEEEAREAACRAEQERKEATRRADEQRIAREEEKRRMLLEEERRKQAAKQKLLELEEKIAKRQGESVRSGGSAVSDEKPSALVKERDLIKAAEVGDWEDGERMVQRITTSASSDSSSLNRPFEANSRSHFLREGAVYSNRGKSFNSWRRDGSESGNGSTFVGQDAENGLHSLRRDDSVGGRTYSKKELYGDSGFTSVRSYYRSGVPEPMTDDFGHHRNERWNIFGDEDHYGRNAEIGSDFRENMAENFGDAGWGHHSRNNAYSPYPGRFYQNPEGDGVYSYGTSRYSMRQPHVPPPLFGIPKMSHRGQNEEPGSTSFPDNEVLYSSETRGSTIDRNYDGGQKDNLRHPSIVGIQPDKSGSGVKILDSSAGRCDSQSSVSVSSPPDSPIHLSHDDDLDEFEDSAGFSIDQEKEVRLSGQGSEPRLLTSGATQEKFGAATSSVSAVDDEEWNDNNNKLQEQEEYDEDEEGYQDDEELREGENVNTDLTQEFEVMHLCEKESEHMVDNLVLGFNEGVEVAMPHDEFEKNSANEDTAYAMSQMTTGILEEKGSVDGVHGRDVHQCVDSFAQGTVDGSNIFNEAEGMRDLAVKANNSSQTSLPSESKEYLDTSGNACIHAQHGFSSSFNMASHSSSAQCVMSSAYSVQNSAEVPIKLQFGLFSGPSLIPSPVPAIQIGSIQMPLHLHSQAGTSLTHIHPSQPPLFQFGQLGYASPVSQGLLTSGSQPMPFGEPSILSHSSTITKTVQSAQETSPNVREVLAAGHCGKAPLTKQGAAEGKNTDDSRFKWQTGFILEDQEHNSAQRTFKAVPINESVGQLHTVSESSHLAFSEKNSTIPKPQVQIYGRRVKRHAFTVNNSNPRLFPASEVPRNDSIRFQKRNRRLRMEFRIRENADKNQTSEMASSHLDDRTEANSRSSGSFSKYGMRKVFMVNKPKMNEAQYSGLTAATSQEIDYEGRAEKGVVKETLVRSKRAPPSGESNRKRNIDKDMDGTLQSGVVQVFEQPGIEAPSDEDNFIEVRSKRQMLNNRREQREKEIKAKSRNLKFTRKPALASQNTTSSTSSNKLDTLTNGGAIHSFSMSSAGSARPNVGRAKVSGGFNGTIGSKSLADKKDPILTSIANNCTSASRGNKLNLEPNIVFESTDKVIDNVQIPVSSWGNSGIVQQFHSSSSIGDRTTSVGETMSSSSVLIKEKQSTTSTCSIKYLLGGENIQFGAVTSSAVFPQSSHVHGVGPPGPCRKEVQISPHLSAIENGCTLLFEKEKPSCESSSHLEDSEAEAEAEAAASAVAVAAITNDEAVGNGIDSCPVSVSEAKSFGGTENGGISTGGVVDQQLSGQSKVEDSLSVSLPADLSVESPPITLWPAMPSPQSSSGQILSHFPGGPTQFPFFEMNPLLRSPMFAFGPHEESSSVQPQTQKSAAPSSSPLATWQQCHSGVDSFYGPPAGFTGPFIGSPGGISGVQGHRHMVVYNHFAPVGQFGQLGLSFMGTTYIPSGKQPDWKHSPATSAMSVSEEEMNSMDMTSSQHTPSNLPTPMQHLAPGSPLLPVASPLTMFDVSPFQSTPDVPVQPHWLHVPPASLSTPSNQQAEAVLSSQYNNHAIDSTSASNKFSESRSSTPSESSRKFTISSNATMAQLPDELGLTETSSSTFIRSSVQSVAKKSSQLGAAAYTAKVDVHNRDGKSNGQGSSSALKTLSIQQKSSQHFSNSSGNNHSKGARASSKNSSGEWSHRRMGFQVRNPSFGSDKIFSASKVKQIYVPKQTTNGSSNSS